MPIDLLNHFQNTPPALDFVLPGLLRGTVGCLSAPGSTGKSFFALEAAMGVCSARADDSLLQLGMTNHGRVVVLNAEDPEHILHHRLHAMGQRLAKDVRQEVTKQMILESLLGTRPDIMQTHWQDAVIKVASGARLLVLETLSRWHRLDENSNGDMALLIGTLEYIAKETGAAVLFLHHVSKSMAVDGRQREQQAPRGASTIIDNARWQGWMSKMGPDTAKEMGVAEAQRDRYVAFGGGKENYAAATGIRWFERVEGGVLIPFDIKLKATAVTTGKKQRRGAIRGDE